MRRERYSGRKDPASRFRQIIRQAHVREIDCVGRGIIDFRPVRDRAIRVGHRLVVGHDFVQHNVELNAIGYQTRCVQCHAPNDVAAGGVGSIVNLHG